MNRKRETRWERKRRLAAEAARPASEVHGSRAVIADLASTRAALVDATRRAVLAEARAAEVPELHTALETAEARAVAAEAELAAVKATLAATTEALDAELAKHAERAAELAEAISPGADAKTDETKDTQGGGG